MKKNGLFIFSLCSSILIHAIIFFLLNGNVETKKEKRNIREPVLNYQYVQRRVVVRPVKITKIKKDAEIRPSRAVKKKERKILKKRKKKILKGKNSKKKFAKKKKKTAGMAAKKKIRISEDIDFNDAVEKEAFMSYYEVLSSLIGSYAVYPYDAKLEGVGGTAYISFVLNRNGSVSEIELLNSSGDSRLDRAAVNAVANASPFPPLPEKVRKDKLRLNVPISFELN